MHKISVPLDHQRICPSYGTPPGDTPSSPPHDAPRPDGASSSPQYPPKPWGEPDASAPEQDDSQPGGTPDSPEDFPQPWGEPEESPQEPPQPWSPSNNAQPPANTYAPEYPSGYVPVAPGPVIIDSELHYGGKSSHVECSGVNAGHTQDTTTGGDGCANAS
ncbi:Multicopper oxidase abr1 [Aspergillus fumigatus]|jgi:iron transport multicopper oxidase|nr:hypothetical protein CNMCM8057_007140 [Aspergillus fumigatus]KAF4281062.1 hypothetical protein CNMCM8689_001178 [Aspergillus fumigatus]KAF4292325.1 hypothetical protein CNMCM8686_007548 [Aspergillus fumigatus]KAH1272699.1 Multicopper oxidase abr1 [Aspergillus fumigatus]KAH1289615.1 Multicopper oxidase abr1 [Aspergillus fumigatus]